MSLLLTGGLLKPSLDLPEFVDSGQVAPNQATHTYTFTLPASRLVIVTWFNGDTTIDDCVVEVGGNSTTLRADNDAGPSATTETLNVYEYDEPTGGSINITIAHQTGNLFRSTMAVFDVKNLTFKSGSNTTSGGNPGTLPETHSITNSAGSCCITGVHGGGSSWTGSDGHNSTPDATETVESRNTAYFMQPSTAGGTPEDFTVDETSGDFFHMTSVIYE